MGGIFIYSDNTSTSAELIALAKQMDQIAHDVSIGGKDAQKLIDFGADKVYVLEGESPRPEDYSQAIAGLLQVKEAAAFFVGATVRGRDLAAQAAAHLKCGLVSDADQVDWVEGKIRTARMVYGGTAVLHELLAGLQIVTIPPGKAAPMDSAAGSGSIEKILVETDHRVKLISSEPIMREEANITEAKRLVGAGMGLAKKDDLRIIEILADALSAEVCCTRPIAEDREWISPEKYVGISGKIVKPDLYLAVGVSGQIQHTYGIRDAKIIAGINNNEKATIFQVADYGIVGDLYEIVPLLTEAIKQAQVSGL